MSTRDLLLMRSNMGKREEMKKRLEAGLEEEREKVREMQQMIANANPTNIRELYELSDELNSCCDNYLSLEYEFNRFKKRYREI